MGFLTPSFLWFLSLLAVIVAFYLFRKQFDRTRVPSTFLWNQVIEEWQASKWWKKLQQNLLFYLQLLFILLIVIALARPYITTDKLSGETGAVVLDVSATMAAGAEESRFNEAREQVLTLIGKLGDDQSLTLITSGAVPELIFANETDKQKMKKLVKNLHITYEDSNMTEAISLASSYIANQAGSLYIYSDDLTKEEVGDVSKQAVVHNIGGEVENLSLLSFGVKNNKATATVKNETPESKKVTIGIYSESEELIEKAAQNVKAGETYTFRFKGLPEGTYYKAQIDEVDDYAVDNTLYTFSEAAEDPEVYFVGEVSSFIKRAVSLLGYDSTILSSEGDVFSYPNEENAIFIMNGIERDAWPKTGSIFQFSPKVQQTTDFQIEKKVALEKTLKGSQTPMLQYVKMEDVYLKAAYPADTPLEPIVKSGEIPVVLQGTLDGQQVMLASFDISDSDWPLHPSFPIFIQNSIQHLAESERNLGVFNPGEKIDLPFSASTKKGILKDGEGNKLTELDKDEWGVKAPYSPGIYTVSEEREDGYRDRQFVVTLPSGERSPHHNDSFSIGQETSGVMKSGKIEWWHLFVAAGLIILLIEWEVYRRGVTYR